MGSSPRKRRIKDNGKNAGITNEKDLGIKSNIATKTKKKNKAHGLASQDQVHRQRRNKMLFAVLIYIAIGAGVLLWKGLTKLPEIPPELESEILRSYPEHLKDIEMPKNIKKKLNEQQTNSKQSHTNSENDRFQPTILNNISLSPLPGSKEQESRQWNEVKSQKNDVKTTVRVFAMDELVPSSECDKLVEFHETRIKEREKSLPLVCFDTEESMRRRLKSIGLDQLDSVTSKDFLSSSYCLNESLSSTISQRLSWTHSSSLYTNEIQFSTWFEDLLHQYAGLSKTNGGKFQITSFTKGQGYDVQSQGVQKQFATVIVYLSDIGDGGEIDFSDLGVQVKPKKGRTIVWNNMDSEGNWDPTSKYRILSVAEGKGHILTRRYYYQSTLSLGKRPSVSDLSTRPHKSTPCVKCFNSAVCHWYDEWS